MMTKLKLVYRCLRLAKFLRHQERSAVAYVARRCLCSQAMTPRIGGPIREVAATQSSTSLDDLHCLGDDFHDLPSPFPPVAVEQPKLHVPAITTLAELLKYSKDLQKLVALGVSLRDVERVDGAAEFVSNLNYYPQVHDFVTLLTALGVEHVGSIISKCPFILGEGVAIIKAKIMYLSSRKFSREQISALIMACPHWFLEDISEIDARLGALQQIFQFRDNELLLVATKCPRLVLWNMLKLKRFIITLKENYALDTKQVKKIIVGCPSVALTNELSLERRINYLLEDMNISLDQLTEWPSVLRSRERILKERHSILKHINSAEYKPAEPGYVSLQRLVAGSDEVFCRDVAQITLEQYYSFLKTL